ncbi:MAG: TolC family protein [Aquabacterium sp.]
MEPTRHALRLCLGLIALSALTACTTVKVDVPPLEVSVPGVFDAVPKDGERGSVARWWDRFGDPVLTSYIEEGLKQNADVRVALARVREARAFTDVAASASKPTVDALASASRGQQTGTLPSGATASLPGSLPLPLPIPEGSLPTTELPWGNTHNFGATLAWEVDIFGGLASQTEMVRQLALGAQEQVHGARLLVAGDIATRYIEARGVERRLALLDQGVQVAERMMAYAQGRFKAGQATTGDVERAELELRQAESKREPLRALLHSHLKRLAVLMGRPPQTLSSLPPSTATLQPPPLPTVLPGEVLEQRPDVRGAARKLRAQAAKLGNAKADLLPRFYLGMGIMGGRFHPDDSEGSNFGLQRLGVGMRLPIFHGGRIKANIAANQAQLEGLAVEYEKAVLSALEDVENAYVAQQAFVAQHASLTRASELARRVSDHQQALFLKGQVLLQPALEAQAKALEKADDLVRADTDRLTYTVTLYKAMGGGWQEEAPVAAQAAAQTSAQGPGAMAVPVSGL